jgi:hypothetical protein
VGLKRLLGQKPRPIRRMRAVLGVVLPVVARGNLLKPDGKKLDAVLVIFIRTKLSYAPPMRSALNASFRFMRKYLHVNIMFQPKKLPPRATTNISLMVS